MSKHIKKLRSISRRDTLKACLVPAGALAANWLVGCAEDKPGEGLGPVGSEAGSSGGAGSSGATSAGVGGTQSSLDAGAQTGAGAGGRGLSVDAGADSGTQSGAGAGGQSSPSAAGAGGSNPPGAAGTGGSGSQTNAGAGGNGSSTNTDSGAPSADASTDATAGPGVAWASGGTKAMQGNYPDPFTTGAAGTMCVLYPSQTLGPCYAQMPADREDISDGLTGLPVRLSLQVVRSNGCTPVADASVDVWHSGFDGIYSAFATGTICNPSTQDVRSKTFCRGVQTTDANGRVDFSTIFPGWYTGRTIHIHFTVRLNGRESVTSQLYFEDALSDEILAQGEYMARGRRDTTNANDMLFRSGGATPERIVFSTAKRPDGVLHAWKVLSIG